MTDSSAAKNAAPTVQEEKEPTDFGWFVFQKLQELRKYSDGLWTQLEPESTEQSASHEKIPTTESQSASDPSFIKQTSSDTPHLLMEEIMPMDTWKSMSSRERHQFLDQFYSVRDKYTMERDGNRDCAAEELAVFQCARNRTPSLGRFLDKSRPWAERLNPCAEQDQEYRKCKEMMIVSTFMINRALLTDFYCLRRCT